MSYIQVGVFVGILLATYALQYFVVRRYAASEAFKPFALSYAGGAFCAWVGMLCAVPAVGLIILLHMVYGWRMSEWLYVIGVYGSVAAIIVAAHMPAGRRS